MKILLIEDEKELAESILAYLSVNDFVCEWSSTKEEAFDKIHNYDYVLLDLMLPDGDGFEVLSKLLQMGRNE